MTWQPQRRRRCRTNRQVAVCGDGVRRADLPPGQLGYEKFRDDGNRLNADGCTNQCLIARCGDGVVRNDRAPGDFGYEACDDGNLNDADVHERLHRGALRRWPGAQ